MYLQKQDYQIRIRLDLLDVLLENITLQNGGQQASPADILSAADKIASDTIRSKVGVLYNVTDELQKTSDDRNGYLISLGISIGLYEIYQRSDDEEIPEKVLFNYKEALNALDKIANGKDSIALPPIVNETPDNPNAPGDGENAIPGGVGLRRIGSAPKRSHRI